jgi:hypothetical protein
MLAFAYSELLLIGTLSVFYNLTACIKAYEKRKQNSQRH